MKDIKILPLSQRTFITKKPRRKPMRLYFDEKWRMFLNHEISEYAIRSEICYISSMDLFITPTENEYLRIRTDDNILKNKLLSISKIYNKENKRENKKKGKMSRFIDKIFLIWKYA